MAVLARYDTPIADQVIEVPKVSCPPRCARTVLCTPQTAEQLVKVPTILYFPKQTVDTRGRSGGPQGFLPGQSPSTTAEQIMDIPAPGRGFHRGLQGFSQGRSSTARAMEQNVDIPVPGGGLHDLPVLGASSSSAASRDARGQGFFFALFPRFKKVRHYLRTLGRHCLRTYDVPMALEEEEESESEEYVEFDRWWWGCEWVPARQRYCWWLAAADGSQIGHTSWRLPWLIGRGPGRLGAVSVQVLGLVDFVRVGVLLFAALGAVSVRVYGVLLYVPWRLCPCEHAAQAPAVRSDDSGSPRLQFIDSVGHCSSATVTGIPLAQTVQKTVEIPLCSSLARLLSPRCCATTGAGFRQCCPVQVPLLQFVDICRHPCGGPDSACGVAAVAVYRQSSTSQLWRRGKFLGANCAKTVDFPRVQFSAVF